MNESPDATRSPSQRPPAEQRQHSRLIGLPLHRHTHSPRILHVLRAIAANLAISANASVMALEQMLVHGVGSGNARRQRACSATNSISSRSGSTMATRHARGLRSIFSEAEGRSVCGLAAMRAPPAKSEQPLDNLSDCGNVSGPMRLRLMAEGRLGLMPDTERPTDYESPSPRVER